MWYAVEYRIPARQESDSDSESEDDDSSQASTPSSKNASQVPPPCHTHPGETTPKT
jgi:hypothetical protein